MDTLITTGAPAPGFILPDLEGKLHSLQDYRGRIVVLNFWSSECPWVERTDRELLPVLNRWTAKISLLPIASNANETPDLISRVAASRGLPLVLQDQDQSLADLYGVQTTPHLFVIDPQGVLRYQGAYDDVTFRQRKPTRTYLIEAITALLQDKLPEPAATLPYGCSLVRFSG